jgi:predicted RNase H-like HicB family nuclease
MSFKEPESSKQYGVRLVEEIRGDKRTWFAEHPRLPGCHAVADTDSEAVRRLHEAREIWLSWAKEVGFRIPAPDEHFMMTVQFAVPPHSPAVQSASETDLQRVELVA